MDDNPFGDPFDDVPIASAPAVPSTSAHRAQRRGLDAVYASNQASSTPAATPGSAAASTPASTPSSSMSSSMFRRAAAAAPVADVDQPFADVAGPAGQAREAELRELEALLETIAQKDAPPTPKCGTFPASGLRPLFERSGLDNDLLRSIWDMADISKRGSLSREELTLALKLISLAQFLRDDDPRALDESGAKRPLTPLNAGLYGGVPKFSDALSVPSSPALLQAMLPQPVAVPGLASLGTLGNSLPPVGAARGASNANNITLAIAPADDPQVPGTFFRTTFYYLASRKHTAKGQPVVRRFSDFVWLESQLVARYPYRVVPTLPEKQPLGGIISREVDQAFEEGRRLGLVRFLEAVLSHSAYSGDEIVTGFMTIDSQESFAQWKREHDRAVSAAAEGGLQVDEFSVHPVARTICTAFERTGGSSITLADLGISPADLGLDPAMSIGSLDGDFHTQTDRLPSLCASITKFTESLEGILRRARTDASELVKIAHIQQSLIESQFPSSYLSSNSTYRILSTRLEDLSKAQGGFCTYLGETVTEPLRHYLSQAQSLQQLIDRWTVMSAERLARQEDRVVASKQRLATAVSRGVAGNALEKLASQVTAEENLLKNLRQRDMFARYCLQLEFLHFKKRGHVLARAIRDWAVRNAQHAQEVAAAYSQMVSLANNFPAEF